MAKRSPFVHLHVHTQFSALDGLGDVKDYVGRAVELKQPALAITDHGNLCGAPQFYHACRSAGIEPIIGEEFYFTTDIKKHVAAKKASAKSEERSDSDDEEDGLGRYHTVVLARGERGYKVLAELATEGHRNFYHKPLIDWEILEGMPEKDRESLVVLSGCATSVISRYVRTGQMKEAAAQLIRWREAFPHFYMEFQNHETKFDRDLNTGLWKLSQKYKVPHVITNDPHYVFAEDDCHHDALLAIQTASDLDDPNRFRFDGSGYHLKSLKEMRKAFRTYEETIGKEGARNTLEVAKLCKTRISTWEKRTWHIPDFPDTDDPKAFLRKLTLKGMKAKGLDKDPVYRARVKHELKIFEEVGIENFLLITWDSINHARSVGIPVGPGRGSVCGTLVGYFIGLHKIDPIKYNLRFDRFLNPARPKMPDIDTDFGQIRRPEMFDYAAEKYGSENVVKVCAYQSMQMKAAFQSVARFYGIQHQERIRLSKQLIEDENGVVLPEGLEEQYPEMVAQLERLSGVKRGVSNHPAGVIIADPSDNIRTLVPEMWIASSKTWVGMYDLEAVEEMGLLKQDFLGLRTLDTIEECLNLIEARTGERLDPDAWVPDEEEGDDIVYKMLAEGRTSGVFQMEGPTNQRGCRDVKPENYEDVVSVTSLYRTGAISAGFPKIFNANRKKGKKNIPYAHPKLKPLLEDTWGVVLYQEQVMDMAEQLAGFSGAQIADIVEAIKHKKGPLMQSMKPMFIEGCERVSGIPREIGKEIWKMIEGYSGYGYNRSHAVAYTFLTYQTARLKALYPVEFFAALLRTVDQSSKEGKEKRDVYLREAVEHGLKILPPDINISDAGATPDYKKNGIRFGLTDIKGIADKGAVKILEARKEKKFKSLKDVEKRVSHKGYIKALTTAGALRKIGVKSSIAEAGEMLNWEFKDTMAPWRAKYDEYVYLPDGRDEPVCVLGQIYAVSHGKTKKDKPYVTWKIRYSTTQQFDIRLWSETAEHWDLDKGSVVMVAGEWEPKWMNISVGDPDQIEVIKGVRTSA